MKVSDFSSKYSWRNSKKKKKIRYLNYVRRGICEKKSRIEFKYLNPFKVAWRVLITSRLLYVKWCSSCRYNEILLSCILTQNDMSCWTKRSNSETKYTYIQCTSLQLYITLTVLLISWIIDGFIMWYVWKWYRYKYFMFCLI